MELDYKILENQFMGLSGSSLLKAMQNNEMPILDLLTREAIQNSLDAKLPNVASVDIHIQTGKFEEQKLNEKLGEMGHKIAQKYEKQKTNTFISFQDKNTTGLTGPISMNDVENNNYGKFLNLIFNIAKPQSINGSGGSCGYGKSTYYRAGIGLVIFYTRIKENNKYKSRLVITFVEDEKNTIIPFPDEKQKNKTGVMWFGRNVKKEFGPLTDENQIEEILNIFQIAKYTALETGTTIIIPYINENKLLQNACYSNHELKDSNQPKTQWCQSIQEYLKVATQRWYAPRLMNPKFVDNPYLKLAINNKLFNPAIDFLPVFEVIQNLYHYAMHQKQSGNYLVNKEEINLRDTFEGENKAGILTYVKLTKQDLKMPEEVNPYIQITNNNMENYSGNPAIITFCRKPGMLLKYDIKESWASRIENSSPDEYIIGLFVANSNIKLKEKNKMPTTTLEEYLRMSEKSDHNNWFDLTNENIVKRIQANIQTKINANYKIKNIEKITGSASKLNKTLTNLFLPTIGYGKRPSDLKKKTKIKAQEEFYGNKINSSTLNFIEESIIRENSNTLSKDFILKFNKKDPNLFYEFQVSSEANNMSANTWEKEIGTQKFPLELLRLDLLLKGSKQNVQYMKQAAIHTFHHQYQDKDLTIQKIFTTQNHEWIGFHITLNNESKINYIKCRMKYKYLNKNYICILSKQKEENE